MLGAICPCIERAPLKMTPALSGSSGPKSRSLLSTFQCFLKMALISLNWVEYVVKKDHLALESGVLVGRSTRVEPLSICETLLISASRSPAL